MDLKASWPKLIFAGVVACVPAVLSYCKASQEADYARIEADAGYKALVQNVRHLEMVVTAQNHTIELLIGNKSLGTEPLAAGSGAGSAAAGSAAEMSAPPDFHTLPDSTAAALRMQSKE
ncbi:MAG TPA: hypothetical protein VLE97_11085 [Gaiellaceae bacterium]|nr:hypothetical protein [Gaiellaceae bacterium]